MSLEWRTILPVQSAHAHVDSDRDVPRKRSQPGKAHANATKDELAVINREEANN